MDQREVPVKRVMQVWAWGAARLIIVGRAWRAKYVWCVAARITQKVTALQNGHLHARYPGGASTLLSS